MSIHFMPTPIYPAADVGEARQRARLSLLIFMLALLASLQLAGHQPDEAGQRRAGEMHLTERKKACRDCVLLLLLNGPSPAGVARADISPISFI